MAVQVLPWLANTGRAGLGLAQRYGLAGADKVGAALRGSPLLNRGRHQVGRWTADGIAQNPKTAAALGAGGLAMMLGGREEAVDLPLGGAPPNVADAGIPDLSVGYEDFDWRNALMPEAPQMGDLVLAEEADFSKAREALANAAPKQYEGQSKGEQWARFLGGAASGALQGGGFTGATLAGAGSGGAKAIGEMAKERQDNFNRFEALRQAHARSLAGLESQAAVSRARTSAINAESQNQRMLQQFAYDQAERMRLMPKMTPTDKMGIARIEYFDKNGLPQHELVDTNAAWASFEKMFAMAQRERLVGGSVMTPFGKEDISGYDKVTKEGIKMANRVYANGYLRQQAFAMLEKQHPGLKMESFFNSLATEAMNKQGFWFLTQLMSNEEWVEFIQSKALEGGF